MQAHPEHVRAAAEAFLPHGFCYLWNPRLLWTHVVADLLIGFAYVAISTTLIYLVARGRREFPFQAMFIAFGLFIVACGATHFVEVYTLWNPVYWLSAGIKVVTAVASVGTALLLPPLVPVALRTVREAKVSEERKVEAERARAELASEERFRASLEEAAVGIAHVDLEGRWLWLNRQVAGITGYSRDELLALNFRDITHPEDLAEDLAQAQRLHAGEIQSYTLEKRYVRRDGSPVWVNLTVSLVRGGGGEPRYYVAVIQDIHDRKQADAALRVAKDAAEAANRAKTQFLSTMSHELRTPLNAIAGYVDLIEAGVHGPVTEGQVRALERIGVNQRHLLVLINDVLQYSTIESGHLEMAVREVPVAALLAELDALMEPQLREARLEYVCAECDPSLRARVDPDRLKQILANLLTNAIKFTPAGGRIEVRCDAADDRVRIRVADTGSGIPAEMVQKIFDPFVQVRDTPTRDSSRQGVGLGLAISRDLARAMGGELEVESTVGGGSSFTLSVPRAGRLQPSGR
jgi:PAS domain S-box-containing protein